MPENRLLVPLDGSALAERTLRYVKVFAALGEMRVRLLAVVSDFDETGPRTGEEIDSQRRLLEAYLSQRETQLGDSGAKVEHAVVIGVPAVKILEEAATWGATLIALSSHGRSGLERWRLGSVADKVLRSAACDTLVVGPHLPRVGAEVSIASILIPLDGSALAEAALPVGKRLAEALGASIHLLRVVPIPVLSDDGFGYSYYPELLDSLVEGAKQYLSKIQSETKADHVAVMIGDAAGGLLSDAEREGIDLIAMTSHGRSGLVRTALGSVTDRVLGGSTPVLVVRAQPEPHAPE